MIARNIAIRHAASMRPKPTAEALQRVCRVFGLTLSTYDAWMIVIGFHFLDGDSQ